MKKLILITIALSLLAGCTSATYNPKTGITYRNFIFQKQFSEFSISSNGVVTLKGYQSEAASLVKSVAEGVATGMGKALVP